MTDLTVAPDVSITVMSQAIRKHWFTYVQPAIKAVVAAKTDEEIQKANDVLFDALKVLPKENFEIDRKSKITGQNYPCGGDTTIYSSLNPKSKAYPLYKSVLVPSKCIKLYFIEGDEVYKEACAKHCKGCEKTVLKECQAALSKALEPIFGTGGFFDQADALVEQEKWIISDVSS